MNEMMGVSWSQVLALHITSWDPHLMMKRMKILWERKLRVESFLKRFFKHFSLIFLTILKNFIQKLIFF
jgi:hypothetical protein